MTAVGVMGAAGRMGLLGCAAIEAAPDLDLMASVRRGESLDALTGCDVAVDLTAPDAVMDNIAWCVSRGIHVVAGTSGFTDERLSILRTLLQDTSEVGVLVVPNFSIGAVLMMRFAAQAASMFESVEIIETHHPDKVDAPSGTALRTAQLVAAARERAGVQQSPDATQTDELGTRGGRADSVTVHSVRLRGAVAHQEVVLGNTGEILTIRHDMLDRAAAMPGLLASVRAVTALPGLTVGLDAVLDLA